MNTGIVNIGRNALRRRNFRTMAEKLWLRLRERDQRAEAAEVRRWCEERAGPLEIYLESLDPALWAETEKICAGLEKNAQDRLDGLGLDLGGGGSYPLLYFMIRHLKAATVVETGVAAGWSSQAILTALKDNGGGDLWSSDFPYFRYKDPEKLIGYVVDEDLKQRWHLRIDGDKNNLPDIVARCGPVDLFHYDSDKSYAGRDFAARTVMPKLAEGAVVIFDDIQDNFHFRDFVAAQKRDYKIFAFGGKFIGMVKY